MRLNGRTMVLPLLLAFTAVAGLAMTVSSAALDAATPRNTRALPPATALETPEVRRIHAHFDSVLRELRGRDVASLSQHAAANRERLMQALTSYNARGDFPHNYDFARPTPYFVDRKTGTLCAVAYLLESTGRRDIVNRVAQANNNVWVAQLSADTAFASWLAVQGITLDEAARIQVPYVGDGPSSGNNSASSNKWEFGAYVVGAPLAVGTALATSTWNALGNRNGHNRLGTYAGVTSGILLGALGAQMMASDGSARGVKNIGAVTMIAGGATIGLAARAILHRPGYLAQKREAENTRRANVEASINPILPIDRNSGTGLSMSIRF